MTSKVNGNDYPLYNNEAGQQSVYEHFERKDDLERTEKELNWILNHERGEKKEE